MTDVSSSEIENVLTIMQSEIGKPYSEANPGRFGTSEFDCSGLIWYAFTKAGIPMPGGPTDGGAAIVNPEMQWLASQPGAKLIAHPSEIQAGDVIGFVGADPNVLGNTQLQDGKVPLSPGNDVQPMGHIGMAVSSSQYVSAYDTQSGVSVQPISGDQFVVAVRPAPGVYGSAGNSGSGDASVGGITIDPSITSFFGEADQFVTKAMWLFKPGSWLRIGAFLVGIALLLFAVHAFAATASGAPLVKAPSTVPLPVPV